DPAHPTAPAPRLVVVEAAVVQELLGERHPGYEGVRREGRADDQRKKPKRLHRNLRVPPSLDRRAGERPHHEEEDGDRAGNPSSFHGRLLLQERRRETRSYGVKSGTEVLAHPGAVTVPARERRDARALSSRAPASPAGPPPVDYDRGPRRRPGGRARRRA